MNRRRSIAGVALAIGLCGCSRLETLELLPVDGRAAVDGGARPEDGATADADRGPEPPALVVATDLNLSEYLSPGRSCADGGDAVSYSVVGLRSDEATLATAPGDGCLSVGDMALLVALQGATDDVANVGNHEIVRVASIAGERVRFASEKQLAYGVRAGSDEGIGTAEGLARVALQRMPVYATLEIAQGAALSASYWDGVRGGVLAIEVEGAARIDGRLHMDATGYRGGATTEPTESPGMQGESIGGIGAFSFEPNRGGGGGGIADQATRGCQQDGYPGGGGAHVAAGRSAEVMDLCQSVGAGAGGVPYGDPERLFLGSGGGSGGTDNVRVDNPPGGAGGRGGGIVWLVADSITGSGSISGDGSPGVGDPETVECLGGSVVDCYDHSGPGGGGAGGTVKLTARNVSVGRVSADGGRGGNGNDVVAGNGGDGGNGLVSLE